MRICHLSDLHAGLSENQNKHIEKIFEKLCEIEFDHLIITGDLTNSAAQEEFDFINGLFDKYILNDSGKTTIVPGNHDLYSPFFKNFKSQEDVKRNFKKIMEFFNFHLKYTWKKYISELNFFRRNFENLFNNTYIAKDSISGFPFAKVIGDNIVIIGIDSNAKASFFKNPACSTGEITRKTIVALEELFALNEIKEMKKIFILHHFLHPIEYMQSKINNKTVVKFIQLYNRDSLLTFLERNKVELILHGHYHINTKYKITTKNYPVVNAGASIYEDIKLINFNRGEIII